MQEAKKITTDELRTRTSFQLFLNKTPCSLFKKLIASTPNLLQGLCTMSLAKSVPKGLNPQECKRTKLRKPPPVPYIPEKDKVQEEVAKLQNLQIKTSFEKDTTLTFTVWHENGTREASLMHVTAVLDAMKKRHQKQHYVPYYLSIVFFLSLKYAFGIISMFFTLVRGSIILSRLFFTYLHPCFLPYVQIY
jgi:hypothetical protein